MLSQIKIYLWIFFHVSKLFVNDCVLYRVYLGSVLVDLVLQMVITFCDYSNLPGIQPLLIYWDSSLSLLKMLELSNSCW